LYHAASIAILHTHPVALLVYLVALSVVGVIAGRSMSLSWIRAVLWVAVQIPLFIWIRQYGQAGWVTAGLAAVAAVYLINLLAQLEVILDSDRSWDDVDLGIAHANTLAAGTAAYVLIDPVRMDLVAPVLGAFALWQAFFAAALWQPHRKEAVHFGALAFTLLSAATALQFDGAALTAAWAAEGAAVMWLGLRERREWLRIGGTLLFVVAIVRLVDLLFSAPSVDQLLILNRRVVCGAFLIALTYGIAWIHHRREKELERKIEVAVALVAGKLLILLVALSEIVSFWTIHEPTGFVRTSQVIAATAIVGASLVWLGLYRKEEAVRFIGTFLMGYALLLLLAMQFDAVGAGYRVALDARAVTGLLAVGILYGLALLHKRIGAHISECDVQIGVLLITANLLTLSLLTSEINAYWQLRGAPADGWMSREALRVVAWTAIGARLVSLGLTRREEWTRWIGGGVLAIAVVQLVQLELTEASLTYVVAANPRVVASTILIAALYGLAAAYRRLPDQTGPRFDVRALLIVTANALTLLCLTSEITAFWQLEDATRAPALVQSEGRLARGAMLSITWALYATGLIVAGIRRRYAPIRYFAMVLFAMTIVKVFAVDLAELDRAYRIVSIVGLGMMLLVTSYLYQRFRTRLS
jgi:uncharacterized membrane protein